MPSKLSSSSFELAIRPGPQSQAAERDPQGRFNIVVLGDSTGRANRGVIQPLNNRKLLAVDVDNFGSVFAQLRATLKLTGSGIPEGGGELTFTSLDDFHPDKLLVKVPSLTNLAEARRLVLNPATAERGKALLQAYLGAAIAAPVTQTATPTSPMRESDDDTMARLLGGTPPPTDKPAAPPSQLEQFFRQVVAPHVSSAPGAWQAVAVAAAEMELTARLNAILHHPDFQALEAMWRGVDLLVRRIESSEQIGLLVLDASLAELQADFATQTQAEPSTLFRLLRDRQPRLLVGNYTFGQTADDLFTLGKLVDIAARLSAPLVATAAPHLVGCDSAALHPDPDDWKVRLPADLAEHWEALRQSPSAHHVGLAWPRFMLRQPYGPAGEPIQTFPFEELPGEPAHAAFLWGHPAVLCAGIAIDAIQAGDAELREFTGGEINDLPVHKFTEDGEVVVKPYAEAWLTDRAVERILSRSVIPVVSVKNQNTIQLNQLRSIALEQIRLSFG
jgi:type VI secretion system protein ImpC